MYETVVIYIYTSLYMRTAFILLTFVAPESLWMLFWAGAQPACAGQVRPALFRRLLQFLWAFIVMFDLKVDSVIPLFNQR